MAPDGCLELRECKQFTNENPVTYIAPTDREHTNNITNNNKDEIWRWITSATHNCCKILTVVLALNTWAAVDKLGKTLAILIGEYPLPLKVIHIL